MLRKNLEFFDKLSNIHYVLGPGNIRQIYLQNVQFNRFFKKYKLRFVKYTHVYYLFTYRPYFLRLFVSNSVQNVIPAQNVRFF